MTSPGTRIGIPGGYTVMVSAAMHDTDCSSGLGMLSDMYTSLGIVAGCWHDTAMSAAAASCSTPVVGVSVSETCRHRYSLMSQSRDSVKATASSSRVPIPHA